MSKRKQKIEWSQTEAGIAAYHTARAAAQTLCNYDGFDRGLEANELFKSWRSFMLPQRQNRFGFELMCEVVSCEILDKCQVGHGPR